MKTNPISIAPMMDWTDRHYRYFLRLISKHVLLYTEMVTTGAILFGDQDHHLAYSSCEHPIALQLGGSVPNELAACAKIAASYEYNEINLNVGCPSARVQSGSFGACLMREPETVADCVAAMKQVVDIPVTVKTRLGVDSDDSYEFLTDFIGTVANAGCQTFIIHARKAWLSGLSPKENRTVPPLDYDRVAKLKTQFPELNIILNGGIQTIEDIQSHLIRFDGVMLGRAAYHDPYLLASLDKLIYQDNHAVLSRSEIFAKMLEYLASELEQGIRLTQVTRHMMGLCQGIPGAKAWRRQLSHIRCYEDLGKLEF